MKDWTPAYGLVQPIVRERNVAATLKRRMAAAGVWVFKAEFRTGWPDYLLVLPSGEHVYVETKALDGRFSVAQRRQMARLRDRGVRVFEVRTADDVRWLEEQL